MNIARIEQRLKSLRAELRVVNAKLKKIKTKERRARIKKAKRAIRKSGLTLTISKKTLLEIMSMERHKRSRWYKTITPRQKAKAMKTIKSVRYAKPIPKKRVTLSSLQKSLERIERTLTQLTLGNVQTQIHEPQKVIPVLTFSKETKPKAELSPLVLEVQKHPIFLKRAKASKNW